MLYLALLAVASLAVYTWTLAYAEFRRKNWLGGMGITAMGVAILVMGAWEALFW